jgi:thiamine-phosphate pyrophosphorylase
MDRVQQRSVYRILDASANRVAEGLRTLEEYARFVIESPAFAKQLKRMRHELSSALALLDRTLLLSSRDTRGDVGTKISSSGEYVRDQPSSVIAAGSQRIQQSMRVLEEYGKLISVPFAERIETLRYITYDVCAKLELTSGIYNSRRERLQAARLYVLTDATATSETFATRIHSLVDGGADVIQLRDPNATDRTLWERAVQAVLLLRGRHSIFIVNDRPDIAIGAGADGVHVGQDELSIGAVRKVVDHETLVGLSTHDVAQAVEGERIGADYLGIGPVFPSQTKSFVSYVGPRMVAQVRDAVSLPVFAIGGISLDSIAKLLAIGHHRVAVTAAICNAPDVKAATAAIKQVLLGQPQSDASTDAK